MRLKVVKRDKLEPIFTLKDFGITDELPDPLIEIKENEKGYENVNLDYNILKDADEEVYNTEQTEDDDGPLSKIKRELKEMNFKLEKVSSTRAKKDSPVYSLAEMKKISNLLGIKGTTKSVLSEGIIKYINDNFGDIFGSIKK